MTDDLLNELESQKNKEELKKQKNKEKKKRSKIKKLAEQEGVSYEEME
jgi:hypothetical protein